MEGLFVLLATKRCLHMIVQEETKSVFFLPNIELNNSIGFASGTQSQTGVIDKHNRRSTMVYGTWEIIYPVYQKG